MCGNTQLIKCYGNADCIFYLKTSWVIWVCYWFFFKKIFKFWAASRLERMKTWKTEALRIKKHFCCSGIIWNTNCLAYSSLPYTIISNGCSIQDKTLKFEYILYLFNRYIININSKCYSERKTWTPTDLSANPRAGTNSLYFCNARLKPECCRLSASAGERNRAGT